LIDGLMWAFLIDEAAQPFSLFTPGVAPLLSPSTWSNGRVELLAFQVPT
jgi:hypothetical protein